MKNISLVSECLLLNQNPFYIISQLVCIHSLLKNVGILKELFGSLCRGVTWFCCDFSQQESLCALYVKLCRRWCWYSLSNDIHLQTQVTTFRMQTCNLKFQIYWLFIPIIVSNIGKILPVSVWRLKSLNEQITSGHRTNFIQQK